MVKANNTKVNSSAGPKASARSASGSAKSVNKIIEIVPPINEAAAAVNSASPDFPCCAIGRPSNVVATAVDAPGIPSRIELTAPPYIAP